MNVKRLKPICNYLPALASFLVSGCDLDVLNPKGSVGVAEKSLIVDSTIAMLIVVVPVIALTAWFAWRYRASNKTAAYLPKWAHSNKIEVVVWTVPTLIIAYLAILTWNSTHALDPYKPLQSQIKPINVEVVALDWKWLFIYPDLGIASVNRLEFPVGTPVNFRITSDSVMNSFFIPQLGGQIYAMAGMQTQLHLIANEAGDYAGESANFSGRGFSDMKFRAIATSNADFESWVRKVKASPTPLDADVYGALAAPSEKNPVAYYSHVGPVLFNNIIAKYNNGNVRSTTDPRCDTKG
ncbi:ubiquinol oxidase subunit II [uncultured Caballeronia sp.]|uniref:ubiquinol oxidase subunit II n=1 Tax=uncultured Caballeronia sp. TaxID=1827198 RepID=UPI0015752239